MQSTEGIIGGSDSFTIVAVIGGLPYFGGKMGVYVVIYRSEDKNTTQDKLAERVGSPVAPIWCK